MPDPQPDPKHVVLTLYPPGFQRRIGAYGASTVKNPTLYHLQLPEHALKERFYEVLREHVRKYGTLDEIVVGGHGFRPGPGVEGMTAGPSHKDKQLAEELKQSREGLEQYGARNTQAYDDISKKAELLYNSLYLTVPEMLDVVAKVGNELHCPVTKRIVFSGCSIFQELSTDRIAYYRNQAATQHMEIVGSFSMTGSTKFGRYVQFTPQGGVTYDTLDTPKNLLTWIDTDRSWVPAHVGKTQAQGIEAQKQTMHALVQELVELNDLPKNIHLYPIQAGVEAQLETLDKLVKPAIALINRSTTAGVVVSDDGSIWSYGAKLHPMTPREQQALNVTRMKRDAEISGNVLLQGLDLDMNSVSDKSEPLITAIASKDKKHVFVVSDAGGYLTLPVIPAPESSGKPASKQR